MATARIIAAIGILALICGIPPGLAAAAPNLIENSSFEAGIDYRFGIGRWYVDGIPNLKLDPATKVHGAVSLKIPLSRVAYRPDTDPRRDIVFRGAVPVFVEAGKRYAFTLYAKADDRADGLMSVKGYDPAESKLATIAQHKFLVTRQWRRMGFLFRPKVSGRIEWHIQFTAKRQMHVWLDALQIRQGVIGDYRPARSIEGGLTTNVAGHVMTSGKIPPVVVRVFNSGNKDRTLRARLDIYDLVGKRVGRGAADLSVRSSAGTSKRMPLPRLKNGVYRAALFLGGQKSPESELSFSVLPEPRPLRAEDSGFGTYLTVAPEPLSIMRRVGARWIGNLTSNGRMNYWSFVEPREGQFRWYDADVERATRMGFKFVFNLEPCRIPKWAHKLSRSQQRAKWANYVAAMAKHYGKTVKHWTIDDEVHDAEPCWSSPAEYALWHKAGAEAIKRRVPDAKIIFNTYAGVAEAVFAEMDPRFVDILATNYMHLPGGKLSALRQVGIKHGIKEFWAPGVGFTSRPFYLRYWLQRQRAQHPDASMYWKKGSDLLLKSIIRTFAHGYKRILHYTATYVGNTNAFSLFESDSALKPNGVQFASLIWLIDGFRQARPIVSRFKSTSLLFFRFDRIDGQTVFVLWDKAGGVRRLLLEDVSAKGVALYDQYANRLPLESTANGIALKAGRAPMFVMAPSSRAGRFERALVAAPIVRLTLPDAEHVARKGAYALVRGVKDGLQRYAPNIGLWHKSGEHGWVEILRSAGSSFPPEYRLDPDGLTITWEIPRTAANFFLKAGEIPIDLAEGARFWQSRSGRGEREWRSGVTTFGGDMKMEPAAPPEGYDFAGPLNYLARFNNGHALKMDTRVLNAKGESVDRNINFGGWAMSRRRDKVSFTQPYRTQAQIRKVSVRVRVLNN